MTIFNRISTDLLVFILKMCSQVQLSKVKKLQTSEENIQKGNIHHI